PKASARSVPICLTDSSIGLRAREAAMANRTTRRHLGSTTVLAALGGLLASACAGAAGSAPPANQSSAPVTLRVDYRTENYIPGQMNVFMDQHPNIKVELVPDTGYEKLIVLVA